MLLSNFFIGLVSAVSVWGLAGTRPGIIRSPQRRGVDRSTNGVTNKYIVEVEQTQGIPGIGRQLRARPRKNSTYYKEFDCSDVFAGIAIESDEDNVDTLRAVEGVVNVWPMKTVPVVPIIKEPEVVLLNSTSRNYSMHQWTGVDKLHAAGLRGKGATVAIIDTGIDYTHKALGGCFGPGCKVAGGYDLVGSKWDPYNERSHPKIPDNEPMDYYGHGTHVAGIIAAENEWLTGVAPDAELLIYKVFADNPWDTDEEALIQSFCDAYSAGADIISASIGRPNGFSDNPWALVASRLVEKGVVVVISAGNEGSTGPFFSSTGSNGPGVLSVAAINVTGNPNVSVSDGRTLPVPAYFTTWGPTNELLLKPDIGAPGYKVTSTVLNQSYEIMSGTSMSAPYVAGVAALYIGEYGGRETHGPDFAEMLGKRIISSGRNVAWAADRVRYNQTAPPFQVGTGLIDAVKILRYDTQLDYAPFALLDTEMFVSNWTADITNGGDDTLVYTFELEPQAGVNMLDRYSGIGTLYDMVPIDIAPSVTLPKPVRLRPGETKTVEFQFGLPEDVNEDLLPLYGGKIWVKGDNGEKLSIPYGGAAYDTEKAFDSMFSSEPYINQHGRNWSWSFNINKDKTDYMELSTRLSYPCFHLRWDIYYRTWRDTFWEYPPQVSQYGFIGSATTMRDSDTFWYYDPETMDKDDTVSFPLMRVPRGYQNFWWFGKLANGSQIAPGNYTMRFAALRPYGNASIADHWDVMHNEVASFQVLPYNATTNSTVNFRMRLV
ncbi:Subtilisin NAT [Paramyrothecium foliicola]|nr:Subtilisin NAT [Paramyrothecium foliicola]